MEHGAWSRAHGAGSMGQGAWGVHAITLGGICETIRAYELRMLVRQAIGFSLR